MKWAPESAEALGAFALVLAGCGAIITDAATGIGTLAIALAFGLVIAAMIYATGHISGAHFNPAVTLAFAATGHFPWRRVPSYVAAQILGGIVAAALLYWMFPDATTLGATRPTLDVGSAFVLEVVLTLLLMFVIASVATDGRAVGAMAGNAIGSAVALNALWAGPWTGASMNPARSIGPALFEGATDVLWLYIAAPLVGALIGARLYEWTRRGDRPIKEARA